MNPSESSNPQTRASSPYRDYNPRKRGRTACTRCKTRKQKVGPRAYIEHCPVTITLGTDSEQCDNEYPVCSNCLRAGAECDKTSVRQESGSQSEYTRALEERIAYLESQLESGTTSSRASNHVTQPVAALLSPHNQDTGQSGPAGGHGSGNGLDHNAVGELVGFLAVNSSEAPAYIGSSSGLSLAANLGEMVQATVWNQVLSLSRNQPSLSSEGKGNGPASSTAGITGLPPQPTSSHKAPGLDRPRTLRMEELLAKSTEPPNDEMGGRILHAYFTRLHVRYPFLDRTELWHLHEDRWRLAKTKREELTKPERFGSFKLYLTYAIGATTMQLSEKYDYVPPERFYITALQQVPAMCETRSVENVEAMTLLVVYHLRSASSQGVWYMIGLAMRTAIDLGLHRKANEINLDPITAQLRRRLFWTVYYLERVVSVSLGRPFSIADRHIDLPLPIDVDDDVRDPALLPPASPPSTTPEGNTNGNSTSTSNHRITSLTFSIYLITLRRIESRIQHKIYRADRPLHSLRSKLDHLFLELEEWKVSALQRFTGPDLDYPMLHYNRALRLLIQPFLPSLPLTDPYYHICLRAAGDICQTHKRLHQTIEYGHSFLAVQTVFISGITLLYALWTHSDQVWSVRISNDIRACSTVLFVMGERATWVKKYRDAFELLVNAAMEKLQGNEAAKTAGMAELMTAQHSGLGPDAGYGISAGPSASHGAGTGPAIATAPGYPSTTNMRSTGVMPDLNTGQGLGPALDVASQDHGVRMALQLAPWIDLEEGHGPFWVPDFETLENFSGILWNAGEPSPFNPL
ncbi:fungal-specific transcription factor domain-containing protein [Aspergillus aurantiobrunneus]